MIVKKHIRDGKLILVVCDSDLIGKKFEQENLQLDLTSDFYKGTQMPDDEIMNLVKRSYIVNITGEKSINFFKKFLTEENIIKINNIPHAIILVGID